MDLTIAGLVLLSAALHPLWNALVKRQERADGAYIGLTSTIMIMSFIHSMVQGYDLLAAFEIWPLIAISVMGQLLYGSSLIFTLRHGDLSSYYPIVRSSPLFIVIVGVLFLGLSYSAVLLAGIACVLVGAFALQYRRGSRLFDDPKTLMFAILAMSGTGIYSIVDARSMQVIEPPVLFFWIEVFCVPFYLLIFRYLGVSETRMSDLFIWVRKPLLFLSIGGICYTSYFLILTAYAMGGDVAAVTSVRQASIPISVILGGLMFREGSMLRRFFASCLLAFGIVVVVVMG
jgi:drug/metabolite transporter (DMT)-like permease